MNAKSMRAAVRHAALALLLAALPSEVSTVFAQGTAFTYQGRLSDNGIPAAGSYDLRFAIYDSTNIPGVLIAGPITNSATAVSDGLFTVVLDFGDGVFTGPDRWLEIGVRTNGAAAFSTLAPRQQLPPVPYAVFAESASNVLGVVSSANLAGSYSSPVAFDNGSNSFSGSFNGDGGGLTNMNAVTLGGLSFSNFWRSTGNSGTSPAKGDFLGTTDFQPLELKAGGMRVLRLEPDARTNVGGLSGNLIGGYISNVIEQPGSGGDFIGGGGYPAGPNVIHAISQGVFIGAGSANQIGPYVNDAFIGAGYGNTVQASDGLIVGGTDNTIAPGATYSVIGGGSGNTNFGSGAFIGGGQGNLNSSALSGVIGGGQNNRLLPGASFAVVAGGYANTGAATSASIGGGSQNSVTGPYSSVQGGLLNSVSSNAWYATIGSGAFDSIGTNSSSTTISGGYANAIKDNTLDAAIGGGSFNTIGTNSYYSAVGGGRFNSVSDNATAATVAGGYANSVSGAYATALGGANNAASGNYSLAAGRRAQALHDGTFIWADSTDTDFASTGTNQFLIRASGGVGINTSDPAGAALNVAGTVKATAFQGDGSGLVNVSSGALGNYVFAYTTAPQTVAAANTYQDVAFNGAPQIGGWSHTSGTAQFTANQTGLYLVQYTAQAATISLSGTNVSVRVTLNSAEIPGSQAAVVLSATSLEVASLSRSFLAAINAADVLKVQFAGSSTGSRLIGDGAGSTRPSVSLTVTRIQ